MTITICSVGTKPKNELRALLDEYLKRFPKNLKINWHYIPHAKGSKNEAIAEESKQLLGSIPRNSIAYLLDERGEMISSPDLATLVFKEQQDICFIIGGAYGVGKTVFERAHKSISLSSLVFPHQIVRLILIEQLYRAYCISIGHPYHHE